MALSRPYDQILPDVFESDITCKVGVFRAANQHLLAATPLDKIVDPVERMVTDLARRTYEALKPGAQPRSATPGTPARQWQIETTNRTSIGGVMRLLNSTLDPRLMGIAQRIKAVYDNADREGMLAALDTPTADFSLFQLGATNISPSALTTLEAAYAFLRRIDNGFKKDCGITTALTTQTEILIGLGGMNANPRHMGERGLAIAQIFSKLLKKPNLFEGLQSHYDTEKYDSGYDYFSHNVQIGLPSSKPLTSTGLPSNLVPDDSSRVLAGQDPVLWLPRSRLLIKNEDLRSAQDRFKTAGVAVGILNTGRMLDHLAQIDMNEGTDTVFDLFGGKKTFLHTASKLKMPRGALDAYIVVDESGISISPLTADIIQKIGNGTYQAFTPLEFKLTT